jgi:GDPmannose 4,6-dehydratase
LGTEITIDEMVDEMVAHDLDKAKQHALLKSESFKVSVGRE